MRIRLGDVLASNPWPLGTNAVGAVMLGTDAVGAVT